MSDSDSTNPRRWGLFLAEPSREQAVARVENEWVRYLAAVEKRSVDASREAEKQVRIYRERERERLDTLRALEHRIASAGARVAAEETAAQQRLRVTEHRVAEARKQLTHLAEAITDREAVLQEVLRDIAAYKADAERLKRRLQEADTDEQRAKERITLIEAKGAAQLRDYEARLKATSQRMNHLVAEAADKVHKLQEEEARLLERTELLRAQLEAMANATETSSRSSSTVLPVRETVRECVEPAKMSRERGQGAGSYRDSVLAETWGSRDISPAPISAVHMKDLSVMLSRVDEQFRDSLVEFATNDLPRASSEEIQSDHADESVPSSALMEF